MAYEYNRGNERGFSLAELMILVVVIAATAAMSAPIFTNSMRDMRLIGDVQNISTTLGLAKIKSTSQLTRYQMALNLSQGSWSLQKFNQGTGNYEVEGSVNALSSGIKSSGILFKTGSGSAPPGFPTTSSNIIRFNTRGIPIDNAGIPTTNNVIYLSDGRLQFAVTVSLSGKVQVWRSRGTQWVLQ